MAQRNLGRPPLREIRDSHRWDDWNARLYDRVDSDEQIRGDQLEVESVKTNRILITDISQPSDETLGNLVSESGSVGLNLTPDYLGYYDGSDWINYFDSDGNALIGDRSSDNYIEWDQENAILTISGEILVSWDSLQSKPDRLLDDVPSDYTGLKITDSQLGYFKDGSPTVYISSDGEFLFEGDDDNYIKWDGSNLNIVGDLRAQSSEDDGLFLTGSRMGYKDNGSWRSYIADDGTFEFRGSSNKYISWDGSNLELSSITIVNDDDETVFDGSDRMFRIYQTGTGSLSGDGHASITHGLGYKPAILVYLLGAGDFLNDESQIPFFYYNTDGTSFQQGGILAHADNNELTVGNAYPDDSIDFRYYVLKEEGI